MAEHQQSVESAHIVNSAESAENGSRNKRDNRIATIKEKLLPGVKIGLLISLLLYLAMLVVGCLGVHKCPVEENIPLFLIATGAIGLLSKLLTATKEHLTRYPMALQFESSSYTLELVFLILGSYWVYKEYPPSYNPQEHIRYCQKTTYLFAFIYITCTYALLGALLIGFGCFLICICWLSTLNKDDEDVEGQAQPGRAGD